MKKNTRKVLVLLAAMFLFMSTSFSVQAAGCGDYKLYQTGTARCTNKLCPGGLKRKERQDLYRQKCVRDNGSTYYNKKYKDVYIICSCR